MSIMDKFASATANRSARKKRGGLKGFFKGVWVELKKVHWPSRSELATYTGVVVLTVLALGLVISLFDWIISSMITLIVGLV